MKLDGLGVILAIILLPILMVITYYIQIEVDTIAKENEYNTKLLDATYDAMSAFEINTANESLSSVADSMRSMILASNNILFNTLATSLGFSNASKEYLQPYIPAVLYTLYDGYYIYAPTEKPKVARVKETSGDLTTSKEYMSYEGKPQASDGKTIEDTTNATYGDILYELKNGNYTTDPDNSNIKMDTDYVLKSYVQYSARYVTTGAKKKDVTINYTLDNYLNIVGIIDGVYYTKTGYLIKPDIVSDAKATILDENGSDKVIDDMFIYNEQDAKQKILGNKTTSADTTTDAAKVAEVTVDGQTIKVDWQNIVNALSVLGYYEATTDTGHPNIRTISGAEEYLERAYNEGKDQDPTSQGLLNNIEYEIQKYKAIAYYISSKVFSEWVYDNLADLEYGNVENKAIKDFYIDSTTGKIKSEYQTTSGAGKDDVFFDFSDDIVKNNKIFDKTEDPEKNDSKFYNHKLEVIKNSIKYNLNLVMSAYNKMDKRLLDYEASMPVLLDEEWDKILSNISIVSFMQGWNCGLDIYNNYEIVSSTNNELTVTPSEIYYVPKDKFNNETTDYHRIDCKYLPDESEYISFKSKEVKYDKVYDKPGYYTAFGDFSHYRYDHKNYACYTCINSSNYVGSDISTNFNKLLASYIGLGFQRQNIYKTNALPVSEGYRIVSQNGKSNIAENNTDISITSIELKDLKSFSITLANTKSTGITGITGREPILKLQITAAGISQEKTINMDQKKEQTVIIEIPADATDTVNKINFKVNSPTYGITYDVKNIKAIYK